MNFYKHRVMGMREFIRVGICTSISSRDYPARRLWHDKCAIIVYPTVWNNKRNIFSWNHRDINHKVDPCALLFPRRLLCVSAIIPFSCRNLYPSTPFQSRYQFKCLFKYNNMSPTDRSKYSPPFVGKNIHLWSPLNLSSIALKPCPLVVDSSSWGHFFTLST